MFAIFARTEVGLRRKNNEDAFLTDSARNLAVVADGMGGHAAGEVASRLAVDTISGAIPSRGPWWPLGREGRERDIVVEAMRKANRAIHERALADASLRGMGTTVVLVWGRSGRVHVAHVGDSRVYRMRGGVLVQLTRDHSWAGEQGRAQNVLTRAIGVEADVEVDHRVVDVRSGDVFVLCSDGLNRTVEDSRILETLRNGANGDDALSRLVALSLERGAPDNVTVVLVYC